MNNIESINNFKNDKYSNLEYINIKQKNDNLNIKTVNNFTELRIC